MSGGSCGGELQTRGPRGDRSAVPSRASVHRADRDAGALQAVRDLSVVRVLVATDGSDVARWSACRALAMLAPSMDITVLNVVPSPILATGVPMGLGVDVTPALSPDTVEAAVRAAAAEVRATIADLNIDAEARVEQGDLAPEVEWAPPLCLRGLRQVDASTRSRLFAGTSSRRIIREKGRRNSGQSSELGSPPLPSR